VVEDDDDEEEFCPVDCVTEFKTEEEFQRHLERSKATGALVVVDFYRPSCGSCKYIEKGFIRLCKGSGDDGAPVVFLKHNVRPYTLRVSDAACCTASRDAMQHAWGVMLRG
jgi:thiol-disulfide isomerase/thioredoxin